MPCLIDKGGAGVELSSGAWLLCDDPHPRPPSMLQAGLGGGGGLERGHGVAACEPHGAVSGDQGVGEDHVEEDVGRHIGGGGGPLDGSGPFEGLDPPLVSPPSCCFPFGAFRV